MVNIFNTSITVIGALIGLLLVGITSYAQIVSSGSVRYDEKWQLILFKLSFVISFVGGGLLLIISVWRSVSRSTLQLLLSLWILSVVFAGVIITYQLFENTFTTTQDPIPEDDSTHRENTSPENNSTPESDPIPEVDNTPESDSTPKSEDDNTTKSP